jgi:hypothetical protein
MTTTDYHQQAQAFLDRFQIKFRAVMANSKPAPWADDGADRNHFRITLSRKRAPDRHVTHITFDFFDSIANAEARRTTVTPYDVLACISGDTYCADTFKEWCSEFGESEDSIRALQTFRRCQNFSKRLLAFFSPQEIEELREIN